MLRMFNINIEGTARSDIHASSFVKLPTIYSTQH